MYQHIGEDLFYYTLQRILTNKLLIKPIWTYLGMYFHTKYNQNIYIQYIH